MHYQALHGMFRVSQGYVPCSDGTLESGYEKIAIYANRRDDWTHAARQRPDGWWTSKLGSDVDIIHLTPEDLEGVEYGTVVMFLKRPNTVKT